jgi:hypothetical protein
MPPQLRVVIAEDAAIMRDGLAQTLIRRGLDVVGAVADAAARSCSRGRRQASATCSRTASPTSAISSRPSPVASVFAKLGLAPSDNDNRRVIAAIKYLES